MDMRKVNGLVIGAFVVSGIAAIATGIRFYQEIANPRQAAVLGSLLQNEPPELGARIDEFAEAQKSAPDHKATCSHVFFGRDALYAYIDLACAQIFRNPDKSLGVNNEEQGLVRIEMQGDQPISIVRLEEGPTRYQSYQTLFPAEIRAKSEGDQASRASALAANIRAKFEARESSESPAPGPVSQ